MVTRGKGNKLPKTLFRDDVGMLLLQERLVHGLVHVDQFKRLRGGELGRVTRGGASTFLFLAMLDGEADEDGRTDAPVLPIPADALLLAATGCEVVWVTVLGSPEHDVAAAAELVVTV